MNNQKTTTGNRIIQIAYWHLPISRIKYRHGEERPYKTRTLTEIIKHVLSKNCSVMIRPIDNVVIVWIDEGRFGQK